MARLIDYDEQVTNLNDEMSPEEKKLVKMFRPSQQMNNLLYNLRYLLPEDRELPVEMC